MYGFSMLKIAVDNGLLCLDDPLLYVQPDDEGFLYEDLELSLRSQAHITDATVVFNVYRGAYYLFLVATDSELLEKMGIAQSVLNRGGRSVLLVHPSVQGPPREKHVCARMGRVFSWSTLPTETKSTYPKASRLPLLISVLSMLISLVALALVVIG